MSDETQPAEATDGNATVTVGPPGPDDTDLILSDEEQAAQQAEAEAAVEAQEQADAQARSDAAAAAAQAEADAAELAQLRAEKAAREAAEPEPVDPKDEEIAALKAQLERQAAAGGYGTEDVVDADGNVVGQVIVVPPGMPYPKHSEHFAEAGNLFCVTCEEETPKDQRDEQGNGLRVLTTRCPQWVHVK